MNKSKRGITLIALVITIIVLLILAAISITMLTGDNIILKRAADAKIQAEIGQEKEIVALAYNSTLAKKISNGDSTAVTAGDLNNELTNQGATADGSNPIKVTFTNSKRQYIISNSGIINYADIQSKEGIHNWTRGTEGNIDKFTCMHCNKTYTIGETINYTPNTTETTSSVTGADSGVSAGIIAENLMVSDYGTNGAQEITKETLTWVVLGAEDQDNDGNNETLLITSATPTSEKVTLYGATGYNNGPDIFNTVCEELYSNSTYGKARSIKIEDVNNVFRYTDTMGTYQDANGQKHTIGTAVNRATLGTLKNSSNENEKAVWDAIVANGTYTPDGANNEEALANYELGYDYELKGPTENVEDNAGTINSISVTNEEVKVIFGERSANYYYGNLYFTYPFSYWLASKGLYACAYGMSEAYFRNLYSSK